MQKRVKPKMYVARCSRCGRKLAPSRLDHAAIARGMGSRILCWNCIPARFAAMKGFSR